MTLSTGPLLSEPETQRVPGGRRAALVVVIVALVLVGTLIWKPWGGDAPAASQKPGAAAAVTSSGQGSSPAPTSQAPASFEAAVVGVATLVTGEGPYVQCTYTDVGKGRTARRVLSSMTVAPPIIGPGNGPEARRAQSVEWHVSLESNSLSSIFNADWVSVLSTESQHASIVGQAQPRFTSIDMDVPAPRESSVGADVYRATVVVAWLDDSGELIDARRLNPTSYGPTDDQRAVPMVEGCPETLVAR